MRLSELKTGESATVLKVTGHGGFRRRIMEMGFVRGQRVEVVLNAPLKDPIEYKIMGYDISLRRSEAAMVVVMTDEEAQAYLAGRGARRPPASVAHDRRRGVLRDAGRSGRTSGPDDLRGAGGQPQQRKDIAVQRHFGRSRACGELQRCDRGSETRTPHLPRIPVRNHRSAGHLCAFGLHARGALRAGPSGRPDARRGDQRRGGVEPRTQPLPDDGTHRHKPAHGRGAQHVRRAEIERRKARLREPRPDAGRADGAGGGAQQQGHRGAARHGDRRVREPRRPRASHPHRHGARD